MSWLARLTSGLSKTSESLTSGIGELFTHRKLDAATLDALEEQLILADMGAATAAKLVAEFGRDRFDKTVSDAEVKQALAGQIAALLKPVALPLETSGHTPFVVLVVGVNGNGKTTTIGKLAHLLRCEGKSVMMAAADTFRAAAVSQLKIWAERSGADFFHGADQADPASVAYAALDAATDQSVEVLLVDTAGRLHNKANLMEELKKIVRVMQKIDASAPHAVIQVLDATTGQNALAQVAAFKELVEVTGLVVTKLDGIAKAGVVVALAEAFALPIHAIGVGEGMDDLRPFAAEDFAKSLMGIS